MTQQLFPRLETHQASHLRSRILVDQSASKFDIEFFERSYEAPKSFPPTGGVPLEKEELLQFRETCVSQMSGILPGDKNFGFQFDLSMGRSLNSLGESCRGEFGVPGVWDFLALVVLPDLCWNRISGSSSSQSERPGLKKRLTGGDRRHVLQRLWKRWLVFGGEIVESCQLTEDDYVATLERRLTLERPLVARKVARAITTSGLSGSDRRTYTRVLMRNLVQMSGVIYIGEDSEEYLDSVFSRLVADTRGAILEGHS